MGLSASVSACSSFFPFFFVPVAVRLVKGVISYTNLASLFRFKLLPDTSNQREKNLRQIQCFLHIFPGETSMMKMTAWCIMKPSAQNPHCTRGHQLCWFCILQWFCGISVLPEDSIDVTRSLRHRAESVIICADSHGK